MTTRTLAAAAARPQTRSHAHQPNAHQVRRSRRPTYEQGATSLVVWLAASTAASSAARRSSRAVCERPTPSTSSRSPPASARSRATRSTSQASNNAQPSRVAGTSHHRSRASDAALKPSAPASPTASRSRRTLRRCVAVVSKPLPARRRRPTASSAASPSDRKRVAEHDARSPLTRANAARTNRVCVGSSNPACRCDQPTAASRSRTPDRFRPAAASTPTHSATSSGDAGNAETPRTPAQRCHCRVSRSYVAIVAPASPSPPTNGAGRRRDASNAASRSFTIR